MFSLFRVSRIIAWPIWNQCWNIFHKILMSTSAEVSKFCNTVSCKQSKFRQKIHSKWKMWLLYFDEEDFFRYAYGIVLFTNNRYFSFIEAVNWEQTMTVQLSLNGHSTSRILAGLGDVYNIIIYSIILDLFYIYLM